jgi:hypothetical protein
MKFTSAVATLMGFSTAAASVIPADVQGPQLIPRVSRNTPEKLAQRSQRLKSNTMQPALVGGNVSHVQYSSNWAGAVLVGSGYTSVSATIVVPTPKEPSGGSSRTQYAASAWVGIDGDTCGSAILQTGVDFYVQGTTVSFDCWYEWFPDYAYNFGGITISAGNTVKMTVTATSKTAGTATITNVSTGKTVSHTFSGQPSLCEQNAEWIVEDFESNNGMVPFANFGTVTWSSATAVHSGTTVGPSGAQILDIEQNGQVLTSCSDSSTSVTCSYV